MVLCGTMRYFLAKTDPETYSIEDLAREQKTVWDGVRNAQALRAIREMQPGDRVFIYHSMSDAAVVGLAKVASAPRPDARDAKLAVVDFEFLKKLEPPTTLHEIKNSGLFADWALVRQGRLSTMAVPDEFVDWMRGRYPKAKI
jgi:predicted RNA-binding protein with PUA-like domain